ncbi:MAG TPA: SCO family protein [Chitinophagaceae bacterium]|nr:SCO family protein [Chitinophagaceae bacterium]
MNKKALTGLLIALILPLVSYFVLKFYTDEAVLVPPHYLADSVITRTINGKTRSDTVWHRLPDFRLTNQLGQTVSWNEIGNRVVVADFFYTHCPTICPTLTRNMATLQQTIHSAEKVGNREPDFIQFLSFSIDPERDSVARLKQWADRFQVNPENWWLLTGDRKTIYDLAINDMKIGIADGAGVDSNFIHTDHFVLIDRNRNVRGYYHGLDTASLARLSNDIVFLSLEKDRHEKSFLAGQLELIAIVMLLTLVAVGIFLLVFRRKAAKNT